DPDIETPLRRLVRRHDVVAIGIRDPREERLVSRGLLRLIDAETGQSMEVDLRRAQVVPDPSLAQRLPRIGVDFLPLMTDVPYEQAILQFFGERHRGGAEARRRWPA
ncbi:MAG TPA: hypothetical protein VM534_07900, partial [Thermoanaerobaculia bacterium]|nr:hypothetical protein [Thermoanaerobaculia bacterium]